MRRSFWIIQNTIKMRKTRHDMRQKTMINTQKRRIIPKKWKIIKKKETEERSLKSWFCADKDPLLPICQQRIQQMIEKTQSPMNHRTTPRMKIKTVRFSMASSTFKSIQFQKNLLNDSFFLDIYLFFLFLKRLICIDLKHEVTSD